MPVDTGGQGAELLKTLGIDDPRDLDVDQLWAQSRGRGDPKWAVIPVGVKPNGRFRNVILRAKDFGGYGFHSVVVGTSGSGKSEYFLALCNGIAPHPFAGDVHVIFVDMKFESAAQDLRAASRGGSLSNLGQDDRHLADRMRRAIDGEIARRYRLFGRCRCPGRERVRRDASGRTRCGACADPAGHHRRVSGAVPQSSGVDRSGDPHRAGGTRVQRLLSPWAASAWISRR